MHFEQVPPPFFFQMIILSMHLYTWDGRHAWFHLHGSSRPARSASEATKYKMKHSCSHWDSIPQPWDFKSDALPTELIGLVECCPFQWPYYIQVLPIPMVNVYILISKGIMKDSIFCLVNVLFCVTWWCPDFGKFGRNWKLLNVNIIIAHETILIMSFEVYISTLYWCDRWCCFLLSICCLYIDPWKEQPENLNAHPTLFN